MSVQGVRDGAGFNRRGCKNENWWIETMCRFMFFPSPLEKHCNSQHKRELCPMIFMRKHLIRDQFSVQQISTLITRWQQSFRPALHYTCGSFVCQTWLHPVISASSPEHSLTCCPCVYIPPSQVKKKKKSNNMADWVLRRHVLRLWAWMKKKYT